MNYNKIYENFLKYFKETNPKYRLSLRNKNDERLLEDFLYTEVHHITPRSQGGDDSDENLVILLPEEHLFIHFLRYKVFNTRQDFLAFRFCLNGYNNPSSSKKLMKNFVLNRHLRRGYAKLKNDSAKFRKEHGWQSEEGRKRISNARKNKFPAVNVKTGEKIGSVDRNHPKVLSGEWVHQTKGFITVLILEMVKK